MHSFACNDFVLQNSLLHKLTSDCVYLYKMYGEVKKRTIADLQSSVSGTSNLFHFNVKQNFSAWSWLSTHSLWSKAMLYCGTINFLLWTKLVAIKYTSFFVIAWKQSFRLKYFNQENNLRSFKVSPIEFSCTSRKFRAVYSPID